MVGRSYTFLCRCGCGKEAWVRWADLKAGASSCKACAAKATGEKLAANPQVVRRLRLQAKRAGQARPSKWVGSEAKVAAVMSSAKQRCTNPKNAAFADYGGRGVQFSFVTVEAATRWVLENLGPPPEDSTLDRIDNEGHYCAGNLRWATRAEQARNRRAYKNKLIGLTAAKRARPDLSDSQLRLMLKRGDSIETIRGWVKHASSRV